MFEVKIEKGIYLVDALTFTEAESRFSNDTVISIKRSNYSDIFDSFDGDRYYAFKVNFINDEEKKTSKNMLVKSYYIDSAKILLCKALEDSVDTFEVVAIKETKIVDILKK